MLLIKNDRQIYKHRFYHQSSRQISNIGLPYYCLKIIGKYRRCHWAVVVNIDESD
jgi:hypothetical protein